MPTDPRNEADDLNDLAAALRDLTPKPAGLDRETLLFRAGQAAAPRRWFWPLATLVATSTAGVLAVLLALRPVRVEHRIEERIIERLVPVPVEPSPPSPSPGERELSPGENPAGLGYPADAAPARQTPGDRMREHLLRWGFEGLPVPPPDPVQAPRGPFLTAELPS